jgi:hypothetical protein
MKRSHTIILVALAILGARSACADSFTVTSTNGGKTVTDTVTTTLYGTTTITWAADANIAGGLTKDSPYWVDGINPDGSMSLGTAVAFIKKLNDNSYLGINTWRLPITILNDSSCSIALSQGNVGYSCGMPLGTDGTANPAYPYSELATLFYEVLQGSKNNNILLEHNSNFSLFRNFQPYLYWSETAQSQPASQQFGYDFWFQNGFEGTENAYDSMYVLPVSTTSTGQIPSTTPSCAAVIPNTCPDGLESGIGLTTTLPPSKITLQTTLGGLLVYDPTLDVSFLANANLAGTLGHDSPYWVDGINPDGSMNTTTLTNFLAALNNPANPYLGITGWTIPTIAADGENPNCTITAPMGEASYGYNCDGTASQLGELFYDQLGSGAGQTLLMFTRPLDPLKFYELLFFNNWQLNYYWQCHPLPSDLPGQCEPGNSNGHPPSFSVLTGYQGVQSDPNELFVFLEVPGKVLYVRNPHGGLHF